MTEDEQTPAAADNDAVADTAVPFFVVGLGASGGDTAGIAKALTILAPLRELCVVLALRDRDALDEQQLRDALGRDAHKLVVPVDGQRLEPATVYLPTAGMLFTLEEGQLRMRKLDEHSERGVIDTFMLSMAQDQDGNTIGLILGETDGDGVLGLTAIKESGGLTLASGRADLSSSELKNANIPAAVADYLLPLTEISSRIEQHIVHYNRMGEALASEAAAKASLDKLSQIADLLRNNTGHDFHGYKRATFMRRVQRRMQVVQVASMTAYIDVLRSSPDEAQQLFNDLLIGVTQFFRDRREFDFLESHVIPKLFQGKGRSDHLRVWVLGCSTGEEAYSLAMLLREYANTMDAPPHIQLFASDIDGRALAVARVGRYPQSIAEEVPQDRLARWFVKEGETYSVSKELREMCVFSQHSIVKDPPFSRLDMVSCRNLLIYLDADLQNRIIPLFHFALRPHGYLFLGNSENVSRHAKLFAPVERTFRIFQKLDVDTRLHAGFTFAHVVSHSPTIPTVPRPQSANQNLVRQGEGIAERYAPAYAIVDDQFDVLHFSAQAGRYIHPGGGTPSLNLLNLVHRDLRLDLRGALNRAATENRQVHVEGLTISDPAQQNTIDLIIEPAIDSGSAPRGFVVLFKDGPKIPASGTMALGASAAHDDHVRSLDAELRVTRERLQAMIEELESANEELKSSNEEYQSLNEELQSANEELETSKEELQSVNEEVTTVNGELAHRVQELAHANSDLKNLLESTQIATIFLDNELRITNFTPAVADIFPLVESDIHRPLGHIKSRVNYDELQDDVRKVIRTLSTIDREIENPTTGMRYIVRVLPYRSVDNFIGGAVVTFMDVTPLTRAERALRESDSRLRSLMEGIPQLVWRAVDDGHWTWSSPQWAAYTGLSEVNTLGQNWLTALHPDDREATLLAWQQAEDKSAFHIEHRIFNSGEGAYRWFNTKAMPVVDDTGVIIEWLGTSTEVHDLRRLQGEQQLMVAELQHRTRNLLAVVQSIARQTAKETDDLQAFSGVLEDRLAALSRAQGLLSQPEAEAITLGNLLAMELGAVAGHANPERITLEGPDVPLRRSAIQILALAIHELTTNSRKYGALSEGRGRLNVQWRIEGDADEPMLSIDWLEEDIDTSDASQLGGGYGRQLIERGIPHNLGGQTTYELGPHRLHCTIRVPLATAKASRQKSVDRAVAVSDS
ncbi:CheR family methyltransferase [Pseudoxanthomonas indica]|uniref:Two-component system, chemotaxis family, CheB/CheR fusion protein n=1 Tax=Pseudoxanthomonas indica TaxID=428993 RepID=A0A1T5LBX9_9GAMM|nr:CheR family methyltransferase [Pseudoxanthomonas indica]SKC73149.1 two-component system, chemotaxis family, CheB/CheR fusion protein [Pseudoxanthomonas indica]